jgi:hypothetical protein
MYDLFAYFGCQKAAECFFRERKRDELNKISRKFLEISLFTKPKRGIKIIKTKPDESKWQRIQFQNHNEIMHVQAPYESSQKDPFRMGSGIHNNITEVLDHDSIERKIQLKVTTTE